MPVRLPFSQIRRLFGATLVLASTSILLLLLFWSISVATAQERQPSTCLAVAEHQTRWPLIQASYQQPLFAQANRSTVKIRYATHSTFRIESPEGVIIATDFAGSAGTGRLPDIVTMNHAHGTHYTLTPDPSIPHVLRGWGSQGMPASHYLEVADTLTRNVTSDIYRGGVLVEVDGNSIFVFEIAGLCIGHVGHLHHSLTPEHFAAIGRLDILMLPVDGSMTMSTAGMAELARLFRASVILPMHWFNGYSLERFVQNIATSFAVDVRRDSEMEVSLNTLPGSPTVIVLQPELGGGFDFDP